jgi:DNA invertase Pin-like site-specific DNA recombinase
MAVTQEAFMAENTPVPAGPQPRAYSYVRFSTPEQAQGDSLRRQTDAARAYAVRQGLELDSELTLRDEGVSAWEGKNAQTGALAAFLELARAGIVLKGSYLIVESLDRISRQTVRKAIRTLEDIAEAGINVVDLSDGGKIYNIETLEKDQMAFLMMAIRFMRANEESELKSQRIENAYAQKRAHAASGKLFTRNLPGWLRFNEDTKKIEVIPERAEVVKAILEKIDAGWSRQRVAQWLNEQGVDTWSNAKRKAKYWRGSYILKLLTNSAVVGTFTPHKLSKGATRRERKPLEPIENYFPPVVERDLYERVTARMKSTAARGRNAYTDPKSIFAGVMKCGYCGTTVTRVPKGGEYVYLICNKAHLKAGCRYQAVNYGQVERRFCEAVDQIVETAPRGRDTADIEKQIYELTGGVFALEDEAQDLADLAIEEKSPTARQLLREKEAKLEEARDQLRHLEAERDRLTSQTVAMKLEAVRVALKREPLDVAETNRVLRQAISKVVMHPEQGMLTIYWHHADEPSDTIAFGGRHMKWENEWANISAEEAQT